MRSYLPTEVSDSNIQFSADNVDHNLRTIDEHNAFHEMGMIATVNPGIYFTDPIPRINATAEEILKSGKIEIKFYKSPSEIPSLTLNKLRSFKWKDRTESFDTLLKISWPLQSPKLSWSDSCKHYKKDLFPDSHLSASCQ